jgi:hypothetical protein
MQDPFALLYHSITKYDIFRGMPNAVTCSTPLFFPISLFSFPAGNNPLPNYLVLRVI